MDKTVIDKFMNEMLTLLQTAKDFAVTQVPEVCKEVLRYSLCEAIFYVVVGLFLLAACGFFARWLHKKAVEENDGNYYMFNIFSCIVAAIGLGMICSNMLDAFKITMAPRIYLIEYFSHLVSLHK